MVEEAAKPMADKIGDMKFAVIVSVESGGFVVHAGSNLVESRRVLACSTLEEAFGFIARNVFIDRAPPH